MQKNLLVLAGLSVALGACHSNGAYFSGNGTKPRGPGVVDCGWFSRDDVGNTYVAQYCPPSRAGEAAFLASQPFLHVQRIETKWNGIKDYCGDCADDASAAPPSISSGVSMPGHTALRVAAPSYDATVGQTVDGSAQRRAAMIAAMKSRSETAPPVTSLPPTPAPRRVAVTTSDAMTNVGAARTPRDEAEDWSGELPPPRPGAPLPLPTSASTPTR